MPSTRDIRRRIRSVKNTAQITKAMQMVAAAKMRKAQQAALAGRPYAALMNEVLAQAAARTAVFKHPLMEARPVRKRAVILVSTDRGLCGALNSNLFREAAKFDQNNHGFHHRRAQGGAIHRPHAAAARRRVHLQGHAAIRRGAGHFQIRAGFVSQGRGGRRGHFVHEFHFDPDPAAEGRSVSADWKNRGGQSRARRRAGAGTAVAPS